MTYDELRREGVIFEEIEHQMEPECDSSCRWPKGEPCRKFSTDGTRLGAQIAHTMGTTDEQEIIRMSEEESRDAASRSLTGVPIEQREFEGHGPDCEAEFIAEVGLWSPCRCLEEDCPDCIEEKLELEGGSDDAG